MCFLLLLIAMSGIHGSEEHGDITDPSPMPTLDRGEDADSVGDLSSYEELTREDLEDIALSVKRHEEEFIDVDLAISGDMASPLSPLSFPGLPGSFDVSGRLVYFMPQPPSKVKPRFLLYSNKAKNRERKLFETGLDKAGFKKLAKMLKPKHKLYIIVHGFRSSAKTPWMRDLKDEILDEEKAVSVVLVDWSKGCNRLLGYSKAAGNTRTVARSLALLVKSLADAGVVGPEHVHYIGHSLGAQTGSFFGQDVKNLTGRRVSRISGLDPAGPLFEHHGVHLRPNDADFVDVLHTSMGKGWTGVLGGGLGMRSSCGHVDFYPNGGRRQPGCRRLSSCSHSKAVEYYADSVRSCEFPTRSCDSYKSFLSGKCAPSCEGGRKCGRMGHPARAPLTGNHFTKTNKKRCARRRAVRSGEEFVAMSGSVDLDEELLNTLGRSGKILFEGAAPEERRQLVEVLREEKLRRAQQRRPD